LNIALWTLALVLIAGALPVSAEIYSYTDAQGNRVFTDRPGAHAAEPVETRPSNRMTPQPVPQAEPRVDVLEAPAPRYSLLDILQPEADATVRSNAGELAVSVASSPALQAGHRYRLLLDGIPAAAPAESTDFVLTNVDRGTHRLTVEVVDAKDEPLQGSAARTFHMMRTSLAQRRMVNPCKKNDYGVRPECPMKDKPAEKKDIPFVPFL